MSYIQFESAREKDKARQKLREARAELLDQAQERAEQRKHRERQQELRGESNWMLPAVKQKLDKLSHTKAKKSKKSKKKKSKSKKSSKKKTKKPESSSESDSDSSSSSSSEDEKQRRRRKRKHQDEAEEEEWVERPAAAVVQRDSWMTSEALVLKTFSRERKEPIKPNERQQQQIDAYDPAKSKHELNPYWKSNGTGLPGFQKPQEEDETQARKGHPVSSSRGWQKTKSAPERSPSPSASSASSQDDEEEQDVCLTDEQINDLAGKAIKAELKGKVQMAQDLNRQLELARQKRAEFLASGKRTKTTKAPKSSSKEDVLLTRTDQSGQVRPLLNSRIQKDPHDKNKHKKKMDTHVDGQRVRYFADDDRYDIKQMFEREKHATAAESNLQYADLLSKHKNPNDDLEDIFADKARRHLSQADEEKRELKSAIREHERLTASLENCERCFDSPKLDKQLLVSLGHKIYLSLPWHLGLQTGHCILTSLQHVSCCTQLDEDAWEELSDYRKALTRMFAAQRQDVIFYEIANKLNRRPHLSVHCIPIPESKGEMAPFYFKKAIEESEQEWCINKQLVSLRQKSLRAAIPKGLPYVWVSFGMDSGFAHVIEDEQRFPSNFALEIIGGMLELNPSAWRKPRKEQNIIVRVKSFAEKWKSFDMTRN